MERNWARSIAGIAVALLVCLALTGCGDRRAVNQPNATGSQPSSVPSATAAASDPTPSRSDGLPGPDASSGAEPTPDAVASELDQINQLINDIDGSVQNSDPSSQGGE